MDALCTVEGTGMTELPAAAAKANALANGLRRNVAQAGRRWSAWPGAAPHVATVVACIDAVQGRLIETSDEATVAACTADLRAILEWTAYQSAALATAKAALTARKTRSVARRLALLDERDGVLGTLADGEGSLIESVRARNDLMIALALRHPHLALPPPLVAADALVERPGAPPGRLALIRRLKQK